jgi:hypothetical protein
MDEYLEEMFKKASVDWPLKGKKRETTFLSNVPQFHKECSLEGLHAPPVFHSG